MLKQTINKEENMKISSEQHGFSHILVVVVVVLLAVVGFAGWRVMGSSPDQTNNQQNSQKTSEKESDIALQNLGLASFDGIDVTTNATREFSSNGLKGFYVFGDKLSGGRQNPNFEYASLKSGTKVVSAIDGIVGFIKEQTDSKDFEVFIQPKENSAWTVGYDHITNVSVKKGASIKAGDVIGEPAVQNNGLLRFEIQINKDESGQTTHYCPSTLLAASVKDKWLAELTTMQNKWESTTGLELYDLSAQTPVGCIKKTLTAKEAEGS